MHSLSAAKLRRSVSRKLKRSQRSGKWTLSKSVKKLRKFRLNKSHSKWIKINLPRSKSFRRRRSLKSLLGPLSNKNKWKKV